MKYQKWFLKISMIVIVTLLVSSCSAATTLPPTATPLPPTNTLTPPTETPVPPSPTPEPTATAIPPTEVPDYSEKVDVGGYKLYIKCVGEGSPTVVLASGSGTAWRQVLAENPTDMGIRVCVYDRSGQGYSELSPKRPRTVQDMAEDLHMLLTNANITGPYVYVGSLKGALIARMYTDLYQNDVAGMVLIDSGHPDFTERLLALLPLETEGESPSITQMRYYYTRVWEEPMKNNEFWDERTSSEQLHAVGPLGDLPLVVLSRDDVNRQTILDVWLSAFGSETPLDLLNKIEDDHVVLMKELAELSTNSTHIIVENSTFYIPTSQPESVVDAIRIVVEKVRGQ